MNFIENLCKVLAHTVVFETNEHYSPNGVLSDARGEDPNAPSPSNSTSQTMQALIQYLPTLMATALPQVMPAALAQARAAQAVSPMMSQLQTQLYAQNAPQLAQAQAQADAIARTQGANTDLSLATGPGLQTAQALQALDPEFYATRAATGNSILGMLQGGLSPAEEEAVNRSLAQQNYSMGLLGAPTSTGTVANAMQFGDAARQRQLQGIGAANSFLPNSRSGLENVALGRPSINTGGSQFLGVNQNVGQTGTDMATNFLNQIAGFQNNAMGINAQKRDWIDRVQGGIQVDV